MQREIKFRAWEKRLKEMIPVYDIQFRNPKPVVLEGIELLPRDQQPLMINTNSCWRDAGEIVLMQFTGLKDKIGKEIYEGDVLLHHLDHEIYRGEVRWMNESADYELWNDLGFQIAFGLDQGEYEIIGNIYENPELLDTQN